MPSMTPEEIELRHQLSSGGRTVIPSGVFRVTQPLELYGEVVGGGMDHTIIEPVDASFQGPVVVAGSKERGWGERSRADNLRVRDLTIRQTAVTSDHSLCMFVDQADDVRFENVRFAGAKHEGVVSGGWNRRWLMIDCEAVDCGAGSNYRSQSGAGFNINGIYPTLIRCKAIRCGQGFEHGGVGATFIDCHALHGIFHAAPSIGFNLGNSVIGLHGTRIIGGSVSGHSLAASVGNVNGRVGNIGIDGLAMEECGIAFRGGQTTNYVPHDDEGFDLEPSFIRNCRFSFAGDHGGDAVAYNSGPDAGDAVYGRAALLVDGCEVLLPNAEPDWTGAPFGVYGDVTGDVEFRRCVVRGMRAASKAFGDFHLASNGSNLVRASMPNVRVADCRAFKNDGSERWFRPMREAA